VAVHADGQRLHTAQHEVAVDRRRHRTRRVLDERDAFGERIVGRGDEPTDHIGVTTEVLGRRVHHRIGAQLQWLLQVRRRKGVVDHDARAMSVGDLAGCLDIDDVERWVGRRLDPHD
jgi:hypothetical protein